MLSAEQAQRYERDGYLVLLDFKSRSEVQAAIARAHAIVEAFEPDANAAVFSSVAPEKLADAALLASAEQVHCFFEEEAFDEHGRLRQAKALSINKIGHALHDRDAVFDAFSRGPALAALASQIGRAHV